MPIVSGKVESVSDGIWLPQATLLHRVQIGGVDIRKLVVHNEMKDLLAVASQVNISTAKHGARNIVMALKRSDGVVERIPDFFGTLIMESIGRLLLCAFIAGMITLTFSSDTGPGIIPLSFPMTWLLSFAVLVYFLIVRFWMRFLSARNAFG